jgi:hypothetical protein
MVGMTTNDNKNRPQGTNPRRGTGSRHRHITCAGVVDSLKDVRENFTLVNGAAVVLSRQISVPFALRQ